MDDVQLFLLFVLGVIILTTVVSIITSIVNRRQFINKINGLWPNQEKIEKFIRPNAKYDYQFQTYSDQYNEHQLVDDKTWSDLNMDALFQSMNFNFTSLGEMRLYATLRRMYKVNNKILLKRFKEDTSFRNKVSLRLGLVGKSVYPHFPDQLTPIKCQKIFMLAPLLPIIALIYTCFDASNGILIFVIACMINIILSVSLKRTFEQDLKTIFYTAYILKQCKNLTEIEGTPQVDVNFNHFKTARYLSGILAKIESVDLASAFVLIIKTVFMLDYLIFHTIQHSYYKYINEVLKCYEGTNTTERIAASESVLTYLSHLPNYYVLAATHDIELSNLLNISFTNYHFNESIKDDSIAFDFKIKPGKANTRNAIELLRLTQFPSDIYERAKQQVKDI